MKKISVDLTDSQLEEINRVRTAFGYDRELKKQPPMTISEAVRFLMANGWNNSERYIKTLPKRSYGHMRVIK